MTKGSLKLAESRVIAGLLLQNLTEEEWQRAVLEENVLQKRSPSTGKTLAAYLSQRLRTMTSPLWELVRDAPNTVAVQGVLAAAVKYSPLLGDYIDLVVKEEVRLFKPALSPKSWDTYIDGCIARDPRVAEWTPPVLSKLRQNVFRILAEADYLTDTKSLQLQTVRVAPDLRDYLEAEGEAYVLRCMEMNP